MTQKLSKILSVSAVAVCLVLIVSQLYILNYDSTSGRDYENIFKELKELKTSNELLSQAVASESSMVTIAAKAKELGFNSEKSIVSLYSPQPLAAIANTL